MVGRRKVPEGYLTLRELAQRCQRKGININSRALEYKFDCGNIPGIHDPEDPKGRRLVEESKVPGIVFYLEKIFRITNKKTSLGDMAKELGIGPIAFYAIAERKGIPTVRVRNRQMLTESDYMHYRDALKKEMEEERMRKENYITTGNVAKKIGTSYQMVIYRIKRGEIPAEKIGRRYFISRKEFEEHKEDWKEKYGKE